MPTFGLIKEQIFAALEDKYSADKKLFQENVNKFVKLLVKSKSLNEMFQHYNILLTSHFDDVATAKEYIEETVNYLRSISISDKDIRLLEEFDKKEVTVDPNIKAMDTLVFGSQKNVKARVEAKHLLARTLVTESNTHQIIDPRLRGVFFDILQRKLKSKIDNLTESELKAITAFSDQDENEILSSYIHLIDDNISTIEEQINQISSSPITLHQNNEKYGKLVQVRDMLSEMKQAKQPNLDNLERLLVLKEGFGE